MRTQFALSPPSSDAKITRFFPVFKVSRRKIFFRDFISGENMCTAVSFREKGEKGGLLWPVVPSVCLSEKFLSLPLAEPKTPLTRRPPFLPPSLGRSEKVSPAKPTTPYNSRFPFFSPREKKERNHHHGPFVAAGIRPCGCKSVVAINLMMSLPAFTSRYENMVRLF